MGNALTVMADKMAERFGMTPDGEVLAVLKNTAFKSEKEVTDAQMTALLVVANQYGLNPWTREIYAFPDKRGGIVPVVGVDGWSRIINDHPQFDGMDFEITAGEVTCIIYRKDRSHPTRITEYLEECTRGTDPWRSHPRRMLRHKAMIQCARLAFGFVGIYDGDEAERIVNAGVIDGETGEIKSQPLTPQSKSAQEQAARAANEQAQQQAKHTKERAEAKAGAEDAPYTDKPATTPKAGCISPNQVKYLQQKTTSIGLDEGAIQQMLTRHGIAAMDTTMTVEQFDTLRAELTAVA